MPEDTIGIYILRRQIGKGGMGAVFLAHDPTLDRPVAIKILPAELAADRDYLARFQREATTLANIRHPNLMHIYAVGCDEGRHFIAMEYIEGHTLLRVLRHRGALPYKTAVRVLGQVLAALGKVHAAGVVHRDIKSSNIMIDEDRRAILMDFGLAKPRHDRSVTTGHTLIGTPEYMAPELAEGQDASFRSDIYALGVVLYEMLTGHVPFRGQSAIATLRQQVESPTPSLTGIVADLPAELDAILSRTMAKKPEERYPTTRDLAADLVAIRRTPELVQLARASGAATTPPTMPVRAGSPAAPALQAPDSLAPTGSTAPTQTAPVARRRGGPAWLVPAIAGAGLGAVVLAIVVAVRLLGQHGAGSDPEALHRVATSVSPASAAVAGPPATADEALPTTAAPPQVAASKRRFRLHLALGGQPVTGRLVSIDPKEDAVLIQREDGTIERIAYRSILRIETLGGQ